MPIFPPDPTRTPVAVDPSSPTQTSGGRPVRPDDLNQIIRNLQSRVDELESRLAGGITLSSPDGNTVKTLNIDNSGNLHLI